MAWNDGISKEMHDFLNDVSETVGKSREVAQGVIDHEVEQYAKRVDNGIPIDRGDLKKSFHVRKETAKGEGWYGYTVGFEGISRNKTKEHPEGDPYEKIANIINFGTKNKAGTLFVSKATKKLKGMTDRINARIDAELEKKT